MFLKAVSIIFLFLVRLRFPRHLSTIKVLQKRYGDVIVRKVREFEKLDFKYRKVLLDIDFLNACLKNNIIPKFVQFRVSNKDLRNSTACRQCQIKLFKQEISNKKRNLRTLGRDLTSVRNELSLKLSFIDLNHVCKLFLIGIDKAILKHKQIQNKILTNLRVTTLENSSHDPDKVHYNLSDYKLAESEKFVLCKGLEFAIPPSKLEYANFMLQFELLFRDTKNNDLSIPQTKALKSKILDTAFSSFDSFNNNKMRSNLSKEEAGKGNTVVITEKNAYVNKMKEIISDTTKFEQINIEQDKQLNFLLKREQKVIDLIKRLETEGKISEKEYELIYPRGSRPDILYESPKVHKPVINNCPKFRPILSTTGTPTYKLAKFLFPIFSPLTSNAFSVHDSFSFADKVSIFVLTISWPVLISKVCLPIFL